MASPIQVTNEDIKALTDRYLVYLLWQLLNLELGTNNIEKYDSQVPLSIYIKDGGIDGIARWDGGPAKTTYLPGRLVGFQAKATDMSEAACTSEVQTKKGLLKPQVRRVVEGGGVYVLFLGRDCVSGSKAPRIQALKSGIEAASKLDGGKAINDPEVKIYDATEIAAWVNTYPAAVARVGYFLGKPYESGMSWVEMSGYRAWQFPYVESDETRIIAIRSIREASQVPRNVIRIVGSSGLGKTRLVFEAFRPPDNDPASAPEQARLSSLYCYISAADVQGVEKLLVDWRRLNRSGVVIVDDCTHELHDKLSQEVARADSRLTLITIGNDRDTTAYAGTDTKLLVIEPTTDEAISTLLETAFGDLGIDDRKFISTELAQGYPQMAILVAQARIANAPLSARLTPEVLARLLGRPVAPGSPAEKVISVCSLFEYIGISENVAHEREFARTVFCPEVSAEDFYANIVEFEKSGALSRYGRLVQVRPRPLAIRLAADWWERCSPELAAQIIEAEFPDGLANAFCDRLRMLDFVPALLETTTHLCGPQGPFGQAKVLNSELGSRLFRAIAEVNPLAAVNALWTAFDSFDEPHFLQITGRVRRNLVWALEKLCFRTDTFNRAADFLSRLAASENEAWSNNATGVFKRLFMILLPGTQAPLEQRLPVLLAVARNNSPRMRAVAVAALENAIRTGHFTGMSGPEYQGSAGPLPQYRPKLWKEVFEYWSSCLAELVRLAVSDSATSEAAASSIAASIRGLIQQGRLDDVESAVAKVAAARGGVWPGALDSIKDSLRFEGKGFTADVRRRVESWLPTLEPDDLVGKLALHVTDAPFEHEEDDQGHWRDIAAEQAEQLGVSCAADWPTLQPILSMTMRGRQQQAFMFGRGLAKGSGYSEQSFQEVLEVLGGISFEERNCAVLSGWLSILDEINPSRVDTASHQLANRADLSHSLPEVYRGIKLNDFRVSLLAHLLGEGVITAQQLHGLSYGQSMAAVSPGAVSDLCQRLLATGTEGAWVALDVAFMFVYGDDGKWSALAPTLKSILTIEGMLCAAKPEWRMDFHAFAKVAEKLVEHDQDLAATLTKEIIDAAARAKHISGNDHCLHEVLAALLDKQLATAWPQVAGAMAGADSLTRWQLGDLLQSRFSDMGEVGLLGKVPLAYLARWCTDSPDVGPAVLAGIVQVMEKRGDDNWMLSEAAMFLLDTYGNNPSVLSGLAANINSFSWSGSLVPYYERQIAVLQPLTGHPIAEVRQWSERLIKSAAQQVERESARDEEHEIGRYS